jgi:hypothetical protein
MAAAAALGRMRESMQAKLLSGPGIQAPGGLARPLILALLLASAMSNGKGGAAAGRAREGGEGPGAGLGTGRSSERGAPEGP